MGTYGDSGDYSPIHFWQNMNQPAVDNEQFLVVTQPCNNWKTHSALPQQQISAAYLVWQFHLLFII